MIDLVPIPIDISGSQRGCLMGPDAISVAGLEKQLRALGHAVTRRPAVIPAGLPMEGAGPSNGSATLKDMDAALAWIEAVHALKLTDATTLFLGGNHLLSAGTIPVVAKRAEAAGKPLFVLWLDAHSDFHTLGSTTSGNLHGTPVAYVTQREGFGDGFPPPPAVIPPARFFMLGLRSVDGPERTALRNFGIETADMRRIDEEGVATILGQFLEKVAHAGGTLHVSLDIDFLDPEIAPAVGTTVPGGATFREAHLIMEMLHDSGAVSSVDLAELNPILDERGKTAQLAVDLLASLFGKSVLDRKTTRF
ncbi:MAG: arginase [Pseudomonadota bacterium]